MNLTNRPEPVMNAAGVAALIIVLIKALMAMVIALGIVDLDNTQQTAIMAVVVAAADVIVVLVTMWMARKRVTPLSDPRDNEGMDLIRHDLGDPVV